LLEEAYEAAEAIDNNDVEGLVEELGDVLMQVMFHADMADRAGTFDLNMIADTSCKKLIRRHPHVFGENRANDEIESLAFWDDVKREEKLQATTTDAMRSVAKNLPQLWRAEKIQKKAAKIGFDWPTYEGALDALQEELEELKSAIRATTRAASDARAGAEAKNDLHALIKEELGDLLFSAVNLARFFDIDPEQALSDTNEKFVARFGRLESSAETQGKVLEDMTLDEMESIYQKVKLEE
jgi:tetrapyrrole methylase family protein/MazG family protein